jgi:hypothetical protein
MVKVCGNVLPNSKNIGCVGINVIFRRVRIVVFAVEKQCVLHIASVCF